MHFWCMHLRYIGVWDGRNTRHRDQIFLSMFQCFVNAGTFWCLQQQKKRLNSWAWHPWMQAKLYCRTAAAQDAGAKRGQRVPGVCGCWHQTCLRQQKPGTGSKVVSGALLLHAPEVHRCECWLEHNTGTGSLSACSSLLSMQAPSGACRNKRREQTAGHGTCGCKQSCIAERQRHKTQGLNVVSVFQGFVNAGTFWCLQQRKPSTGSIRGTHGCKVTCINMNALNLPE